MAKRRGRLDPGEVKRALAADQPPPDTEPFHTPFAAARARLEKLVVPGANKLPAGVQRRASRTAGEPSVLAKARAARRAEHEALAEAIRPRRRQGARRDGKSDSGAGDGGDR